MLVREMAKKNQNRNGLFEVQAVTGEKLVLCWASFTYPSELKSLLARHPRLMEFEIINEHFMLV